MQDRRYLLSLKELIEENADSQDIHKKLDELQAKIYDKLDKERLKKLEHIKRGRKLAESIGAGLLLQLAVSEALADKDNVPWTKDCIASESVGMKDELTGEYEAATHLSLQQLLGKLSGQDAPLSLEYAYGVHGKPYLKNYPYYFSISHSGDYVLCVLSEQEVGADIQQKAPTVNERVLQRFFAPEEKVYWEQCDTDTEKRDFFYRMWCRKEAYGKLTGEGIGDAVSVNMNQPSLQIQLEEYTIDDDYQIAICKWK